MHLGKSFMKGRKNNVAIRENFRRNWTEKDYQKHNDQGYSIDRSRTPLNTVLIQPNGRNIHEIVNNLVADKVADYNAGKKPSRQITDFYEKELHGGRNGQKREIGFEYVVGIGSLEDFQTATLAHPETAKPWTLTDYFQREPERIKPTIDRWYETFLTRYQTQNPKLKVVSAVVHWDESTPHMHMVVVPWAEKKNGIGVSLSLDTALKQQGFVFDKVNEKSPLEQYNANVHDLLETLITQEIQGTVRLAGTRDKSLSVPELKAIKVAVAQEKTKETKLNSVISSLEARRDVLTKEAENLSKENQKRSEAILEASERLSAIRKKISKKTDDLHTLEQQWNTLHEQVKNEQEIEQEARLDALRLEKRQLENQIEQRHAEIKAAATPHSFFGTTEVIEDLFDNAPNLIELNNRLKQENQALREENDGLNKRVQTLTVEKGALQRLVQQKDDLIQSIGETLVQFTERLEASERQTWHQKLGYHLTKTAVTTVKAVYDRFFQESPAYQEGEKQGRVETRSDEMAQLAEETGLHWHKQAKELFVSMTEKEQESTLKNLRTLAEEQTTSYDYGNDRGYDGPSL